MNDWWTSLDARARGSLAASAACTLLLFAAAGWWLLRVDHAVLFADLRPQDAATMTAELEKLKIPFSLADNGATLLVDRSQVPAVRLKLMGKDMPLHGSVGFELFNHTDFGMTEFAQKINYQRALQGELTRTILSFAEIRDARVHLALPEQGLFKQNVARPKAAITLNLRQGHGLRPEQVTGIQRLVAAAVPGLTTQDVTLVDQHGVTLSRAGDGDSETTGGSSRMDLKRETENYLSRKATVLLDKAFGPGQALASVDVTLNMDHVKVTTEDVIAAPDARGGATTGVLVRERESAKDSAAPDARAPDARNVRGSSMQRDVEYQAGRRVEQVVSHPGAIRRIHIVAVVRQALDDAQKEQLLQLVAAAVGASPERGDTVVVQTLQVAATAAQADSIAKNVVGPTPSAMTPSHSEAVAAALIAAGMLAVMGWMILRRRLVGPPPRGLTQAQRQASLARVQQWMLQSDVPVDIPDKAGSR